MISVTEAKQSIKQNCTPLKAISLPLAQCLGACIAEDIYAEQDIPAYPQSSMDGYAFAFDSWDKKLPLLVVGEMAAGADAELVLQAGQAARIFTGAPIPAGADTVVMQERIKREGDSIFIKDESLVSGINTRAKGSEIRRSDLALDKGTVLSPAAIGFLSGMGLTHAYVYPKPKVSIITTGKELQRPGNELLYGQVYESNSITLLTALQQVNIEHVNIFTADDVLETLVDVLHQALYHSDIVLLTGGISVGDYDFVLQAAEQCEVTQLFHKVKQRPGKPLYFGKRNHQLVFGLPGNPSSVLSCFYNYVLPAISIITNTKNPVVRTSALLANDYEKPAGLTHFLKGYFDGETATPLNAQESYRLSSFAKANCLIELAEEQKHFKKDDTVPVHILPF